MQLGAGASFTFLQLHRRQTSVANEQLSPLSTPSDWTPFISPLLSRVHRRMDASVPFPRALSSNGKREPVYTGLSARTINRVTDPTGHSTFSALIQLASRTVPLNVS